MLDETDLGSGVNGSLNGDSNLHLHPFPKIAKKALEAKLRKPNGDSKQLQNKQVGNVAKQLPLWGDGLRCLPNEIVRSALFNAKNRRQAREYLRQSNIAVIGEGKITFTGEELRQDDETVWLQLLHLAKECPLGNTINFTPYSLCKAIGWSIDGRSYERLRQSLGRMQATSLSVYSQRLKEGVSLSMIPMFKWRDEAGIALSQYQVKVAPELLALFGDVHYTKLEWSQRCALPDGMATWLHSYYASHNKPYAVKIGTLKRGAGITTESLASLRQLIERALTKLVDVGFLESWQIIGELVSVKRKHILK